MLEFTFDELQTLIQSVIEARTPEQEMADMFSDAKTNDEKYILASATKQVEKYNAVLQKLYKIEHT